ncbi:hypothetical protein Tco_1059351 [Tanacetum coccineum]
MVASPLTEKRRRKCVNEPRKLSESLDTSTGKDLWEDFRHEKSFHIPTPALDEVCEECLSSMKEKAKGQFSNGDNRNEPPPTLHYSVSNKSKFPLTGLGLLTRESGKRKQNISNVANAPESVITSCSKQPFPKLTVSPLRKFQLIDSDYDSNIPSISKVNKTCNTSEPYLNRGKSIGLDQPGKLSESLL